jgi:nicotinamidase-related amidase
MNTRNVRHKSRVALLLVDVINHFTFQGGKNILHLALPIAPPLARLKKRARAGGVPTIYANDNFSQWRSDARKLLQYCLRPEAPGFHFVEQLQPDDEDYFVLKPMHSAFYQTPLDLLLRELGASSIILSGLATNSCILCTAHDANMRHVKVIVPRDCCAARTAREHSQALEHIGAMAGAKVVTSSALRLETLHG